jgi:hypothetical protein
VRLVQLEGTLYDYYGEQTPEGKISGKEIGERDKKRPPKERKRGNNPVYQRRNASSGPP